MMKKFFTIIMMALAVLISPIFGFNMNTVEARSDYYIGYDPEEGCDAYIDVDSIIKHGYYKGGRDAEATVYWTNGYKRPNMCVRYVPSTGVYYFSGGAGGVHKATGFRYSFCVICDRFAYGS